MGEDRLPRNAYMMLCNLDARGKRNWVSNVRMQLFQYGFGFVWMNQGVRRENVFIRAFRERLIDCRQQNREDHVQTSDRFSMYRQRRRERESQLRADGRHYCPIRSLPGSESFMSDAAAVLAVSWRSSSVHK